ncbi:MAG: SusD/RagB family nutrient-binding outer membrane lipoprotein [Bacteroidales bacterium]
MKKILYITITLAFLLGSSSCEKWLDINVDPDNPNDLSATPEIRLPWIQHYYMYAWGTANMRTSTIAGILTQTSTTASNGRLAAWNPLQASCTTIYQNWFLGAAVNLNPLISKAEEAGAYHYIGAAYCIKAMGFMMMLDLHGEMPYTEALSGKYNPAYDQGDVIYNGCLADLDKAIEFFGKAQEAGAPALSEGDTWNGGDVNKWIKMCYGLKARYLLQVSKKSSYDGAAVLAALQNAPQSNADNIVMKHYNVEGDALNFTVGDPYQTNSTWNSAGYGTGQRTTRWYANLLTNSYTGGSGVIDPRMPKLLPAMMKNIKLNAAGDIISYEWARDIGVDMMNSDIRQNSGPINASYATAARTLVYTIADATARDAFIASVPHPYTVSGNDVSVTYRKGSFYINSTNYKRAGDTVYVNLRSNSMSTSGLSPTDMYFYPTTGVLAVGGTGTFHARPDSDSDILTWSEMCFIKAEVYLRQGSAPEAFTAYRAGIQANFDRMQTKLNEWKSAGTINPDQMPMNEADIAAYMASAAVVQTASALTMADIIKQKIIALGFNMQNWNDMRRFNYSAGNIGSFGVVYRDYMRPYEFTANNIMVGTTPTDPTYWFRRFSQSTHESNYNNAQLMLSNPLAMKDAIWSDPVWWDKP